MFDSKVVDAIDDNTAAVTTAAEQISNLNQLLSTTFLNFYDTFLKATSALNRIAELEKRQAEREPLSTPIRHLQDTAMWEQDIETIRNATTRKAAHNG